jgi:hypothetical protein
MRDDVVVQYSPRFSKPGRRPPRLSGEVIANRSAVEVERMFDRAASIDPDASAYRAQRDLGWLGVLCCLASAALVVGAVVAFHHWVMP